MLLNANHNGFKSSRTGSSEFGVLLTNCVLSPGTYLSVDVGVVTQFNSLLLTPQAVWHGLTGVDDHSQQPPCSTMLARQRCLHLVPRYRSFCWLPMFLASPTERVSDETITEEIKCSSVYASSVPVLVSFSLLYNAVFRAELTVLWSPGQSKRGGPYQ
jgi:hypothetical protein